MNLGIINMDHKNEEMYGKKLQNLWMAWILSMNFKESLYETGICYLLTIFKNVSEKKLQQVEFLQRKQRVALLQQT